MTDKEKLIEEENEKLKKQIEIMKKQIKIMKNCENCRYAYDKKHDCMPCENMEDWTLIE